MVDNRLYELSCSYAAEKGVQVDIADPPDNKRMPFSTECRLPGDVYLQKARDMMGPYGGSTSSRRNRLRVVSSVADRETLERTS